MIMKIKVGVTFENETRKSCKGKIFYEKWQSIFEFQYFNAMFVVKAQRGQSEIATDVLKMTISHLTQDLDYT